VTIPAPPCPNIVAWYPQTPSPERQRLAAQDLHDSPSSPRIEKDRTERWITVGIEAVIDAGRLLPAQKKDSWSAVRSSLMSVEARL
jgi:hypothetical protein